MSRKQFLFLTFVLTICFCLLAMAGCGDIDTGGEGRLTKDDVNKFCEYNRIIMKYDKQKGPINWREIEDKAIQKVGFTQERLGEVYYRVTLLLGYINNNPDFKEFYFPENKKARNIMEVVAGEGQSVNIDYAAMSQMNLERIDPKPTEAEIALVRANYKRLIQALHRAY